MKFYKRQNLNAGNPMDDSWVATADGRLTTNSTSAMETPSGSSNQRPPQPEEGSIRYNTQIGAGELEVFVNNKWETIKTNRQQQLTLQNFTNGDYLDRYFGPLSYNIDTSRPQNILVFVDNVYQVPYANYTLAESTIAAPLTTSTIVTQTANFGDTVIHIGSVADFNVGGPVDGTNLNGNTITAVSATDQTITVFPGALGPIYPGDPVIAKFSTGTYIVFAEDAVPVPSKPVTVLMGIDGYTPPFGT